MTDFPALLIADRGQKARAIHLVDKTSFDDWVKGRPAEDRALLDAVEAAFGTVGELIGRHRFKQGIGEAMRIVGEVNKYVSDTEPWKIKEDPERLGTVLHVMAQCVVDV